MNTRFFLTLLFVGIFSVKSQNKRFLYEYNYIPDSLNIENVENETMALDIFKGFSKFYSYDKFQSDSISQSLNDKSIIATGSISNTKEILKGKINYIVSKKYPNFETNFISRIGQTKYLVQDSEKMNWKILNEKQKLNSFNVQKAESEFGGRKWIAWFTNDIPIQDGPYKFHGLPGMILEISDIGNNHTFKLIEIQNIQEISEKSNDYVLEFGNSKKISSKQYKNLYNEFRRDPNKSIRQTLQDMDEINENGKMVNKNEYLKEREKRIFEQNKKNNNPIEKDLLLP